MSGISPTSSSTSGTSSSLSNLSSVGQALETTGQTPVLGSITAANTNSNTISSYQAEFDTLQQDDTAELLYASFLSPSAGLANADAVLGQAATLLGTPGNPGTLGLSQSTASTGTSTSSSTGSSTSSSTDTDPLASLPSVADILAASEEEAQQTLQAYSNAPAGSSIIDYQV
jgi:hypothetical protein